MLVAWCSFPSAAEVDYEQGTIELLSDGAIYVRGPRGMHVLEPLGDCTWCEVELEVMIRFRGFTRATLSPYLTPGRVKPLKVLVIRDGRDEQ
jgi:hypothetical protein